MSKIFVYGIDGGSFSLINSFVEHGYLPFYKKLIQNGAYGKFISTIPPHTAPGWASIATGVNPGTHGIYQFWKTNGTDYIGKYQGSKDWKSNPIWKILNDYNLKTGIINVPMTHPPAELDGFMISWPLSKTLNYCYPKTLLNEIAKAGGHFSPDIYVMYTGQQDYLKSACEITRKRVKTIQYLIKNKEWDFFMTVFPEVDRISHYYWNFMDTESPYFTEDKELKSAILEMYVEVDKAMGEIIECLPEDVLFVSLSDHGFRVGTTNFNLDSFLIEKGYMTLKKTEHTNRNEENASQKENDWFCTTWQGDKYEVDWNKTKLFLSAPGSYGVNFNLLGRQCEGIIKEYEKEELFKQLQKDLLAVKHPYKDTPLFKEIVKGNEVYKGESEEKAPDILLIPEDYSIMVSHHLKVNEVFSEPEQKGMHCREGYILFYGVGVQKGKQLKDSELEDFVPTILKYLGIRIPSYIQGKVIDVFTENVKNKALLSKKPEMEDTSTSNHQQELSYTEQEYHDIEQRLKGLGYL